jgi:hypothetical protein
MNIEDINKYILEIKFNLENENYFWEIWKNENIILKSDRGYKTKYECNKHLITVCAAFKYLYEDKQITL